MAKGTFVNAVNQALTKGYITPEESERFDKMLRNDLKTTWQEILDLRRNRMSPASNEDISFAAGKVEQFTD